MEPVIQVGWDEGSVVEEDFRKEAVRYVQENYKEIEKKMKGHQKGIQLNRLELIVHILCADFSFILWG